jgi:hypothetical protein
MIESKKRAGAADVDRICLGFSSSGDRVISDFGDPQTEHLKPYPFAT